MSEFLNSTSVIPFPSMGRPYVFITEFIKRFYRVSSSSSKSNEVRKNLRIDCS